MAKNNEILVGVHAPYSVSSLKNTDDEIQNGLLERVYHSDAYTLMLKDVISSNRFNIVTFDPKKRDITKHKENDNDYNEIIYSVIKIDDKKYEIHTGNYIGTLIIKGKNKKAIKLKINTGYEEAFTKRLINFANNVYSDNEASFDSDQEDIDSLEFLLQYLFLTSLRKALINGFPKKYVSFKDVGYKIRGNLNINEYIKKGLYMKKPSFTYRERVEIESIVSVISYAYSLCNKKYIARYFKDITVPIKEVSAYMEKVYPSSYIFNKAKNESALNNEMYSPFKSVIKYAEMLVKNDFYNPDTNENTLARGWLINVNDLRELYIGELLRENFKDWEVHSQIEKVLYKGKFYERKNIPDFVLKKDNSLVILDAKFKRMKYESKDVDREDLFQIHSYYGMYLSERKYDIKLVSLIYPSTEDPIKDTSDYIFGNKDTGTKFNISYIKIGKTSNEQFENEKSFIQRLKALIL